MVPRGERYNFSENRRPGFAPRTDLLGTGGVHVFYISGTYSTEENRAKEKVSPPHQLWELLAMIPASSCKCCCVCTALHASYMRRSCRVCGCITVILYACRWFYFESGTDRRIEIEREGARLNINIQISRPDSWLLFLLISPLLFLATTYASWKDNDSGEIIWISLSCLPVYCWCWPITAYQCSHHTGKQTAKCLCVRHVIQFPFFDYCHIIDGYQKISQIANLGDTPVWLHFHYRFVVKRKCVWNPHCECSSRIEMGTQSNLIPHTEKPIPISYTNNLFIIDYTHMIPAGLVMIKTGRTSLDKWDAALTYHNVDISRKDTDLCHPYRVLLSITPSFDSLWEPNT